MKKFTIPCDFSGQKHPFRVYVGEPRNDRHPLQNQAHWLSSERGGNIPPDVMEGFHKLHNIAMENNVSFEDLCMYAFENTDKGKASPYTSITKTEEKIIYLRFSQQKLSSQRKKKNTEPEAKTRLQILEESWGYTPLDIGDTYATKLRNFYAFCCMLYPESETEHSDARLLLFAVGSYLFMDPNKPSTLPELCRMISSDDLRYSLCVVLDTIGNKMLPFTYQLIVMMLQSGKTCQAAQFKLVGRLVQFSLTDTVKNKTYQKWQRDLRLYFFGPDEICHSR